MSNVVRINTQIDVAHLWEEYAALIRATQEDASLLSNVRHMQAAARAHARWQKAFLASENAA
ncbi:hypothetical protein [Sphingobium yanoikuyae]|jgi:hypothetical protein|uniref:Uncharacterized protein n=1 Tax=Sphingobium yanoikuyae TaxID=13690 RepID=A0A430BZ99_SPHYA|nr:hypothetical protein [Sphingobium yanoikuyae]RSU58031.1 hypothetical protein DAH51_07245 [Sphingobium yanoikuyae]